MKALMIALLMGSSLDVLSEPTFAGRSQDLMGQYRQLQNSPLFDMLQHYYFKSPETANAMKSAMDSHQLEEINQQLMVMNKNLNTLISLEKQRINTSTIKKG